jgi:hypothetical protein
MDNNSMYRFGSAFVHDDRAKGMVIFEDLVPPAPIHSDQSYFYVVLPGRQRIMKGMKKKTSIRYRTTTTKVRRDFVFLASVGHNHHQNTRRGK